MKWLNSIYPYCTVLAILILFSKEAQSQQLNFPLNHAFGFTSEQALIFSDSAGHSAFKPLLISRIKKEYNISDSLDRASFIPRRFDKSFVSRKLFHEHLITLDTGIVRMTIDPLINFEFGREFKEDPRDIDLYKNTRGFIVKLQLGEKVAVESSFRENQANLPYYLSYRVGENQEAYGQGRVKSFGDFGYDFAMASAYISYSPSNRFNIQAGHGKHFVGNGYRTLLLSDMAFNYPYLKLNSSWMNNKVQYQNLYTLFQDLERLSSNNASEGLFERKQGAFHFLEVSPNSKISFGLFEGIVYPSIDSTGNVPVDFNYWVPIIFLNTIIEGSKDEEDRNAGSPVIGTNLSVHIAKRVELYNQFSISSFDFSLPGLQLGFKYYFLKYFLLQGELNRTANPDIQNIYTHYNQSLNLPIQSGSTEAIGIIHFQKDRWQTRVKLNQIASAEPKVQIFDFKQSYIVNPSYNFTIHVGGQLRSQEYSIEGDPNFSYNPNYLPNNNLSYYLYFGLSTNLQNLYFDY